MTEDQSALRTLSEVVRDRRHELGLSTRTLAERCVVDTEAGTTLSRHYIERLEKDVPTLTPPRVPELKALAMGLELPLRVIQDAAGFQFHGVTTRRESTAAFLIPELEEVDPEQQEQIVAMLRAFVAANPKKKR
ncbi:helix-turn-helix domain-containing protein [Streptomyces sp. NPDC057854]|uniref:helix-turn-helix domain-containing protein n=1 Tax=unclassified Streptomyces TaxID=2593676 RepID=UPI0036AE8835